MALGSIFGGFGAQVGGQVGAKLAPKSEEMGYQDDVKKSSKIWRREGTQWYASKSGPSLKESLRDPLILEYESTRGKPMGLRNTPSRAQGPGADIYIYIYIYIFFRRNYGPPSLDFESTW